MVPFCITRFGGVFSLIRKMKAGMIAECCFFFFFFLLLHGGQTLCWAAQILLSIKVILIGQSEK